VVQAAAEQVAQVEGGGAALEPRVVLEGASVAKFQAAPAAGGDLRDGAFDVGSVLGVLRSLVRVVGPGPAGGA
jgi:hypothetical protein